MFDHSSISRFIDRIGRNGSPAIFDGLNDELLRMGLLSPEMYVDASLVKANVSGYGLEPSGMTVAEFKDQAIEGNGLFLIEESTLRKQPWTATALSTRIFGTSRARRAGCR